MGGKPFPEVELGSRRGQMLDPGWEGRRVQRGRGCMDNPLRWGGERRSTSVDSGEKRGGWRRGCSNLRTELKRGAKAHTHAHTHGVA